MGYAGCSQFFTSCSQCWTTTCISAPAARNPLPLTRMLGWNSIYLYLAVIAGLFGFTGTLQESAQLAKILFFLFLVSLLVSELIASRGKCE